MYLRVLKSIVCAAAALFVLPLAAQTQAPTPNQATLASAISPTNLRSASGPSSANQLIERIQVEGGDTRIDEIRVGGETRNITVTPNGFPAYTVQPRTGERTWKLFDF